jgi:hypothetical protein
MPFIQILAEVACLSIMKILAAECIELSSFAEDLCA